MSWRKTQQLGWKKLSLMNITSLCDKRNVREEADSVNVLIASLIDQKELLQQWMLANSRPVLTADKPKAPALTPVKCVCVCRAPVFLVAVGCSAVE